jgi:hypothetical protein
MILLGFDVNAIPIRGVVKFLDQKSWRGEADSTCQPAADAEEFAGKRSTIRPVRVEPRIFLPVKCSSVLARIGFLDDWRLILFSGGWGCLDLGDRLGRVVPLALPLLVRVDDLSRHGRSVRYTSLLVT